MISLTHLGHQLWQAHAEKCVGGVIPEVMDAQAGEGDGVDVGGVAGPAGSCVNGVVNAQWSVQSGP
jgi:hypothetical protein